MTHPPTRADQIRMAGAGRGANVGGGAQMTAIDMDDTNIKPDAWFVYLMPYQMGVQMIGAGRYGFWDDRPDVKIEDDCVIVSGKNDEPIFVSPKSSVISVIVAQAAHINALPFPEVKPMTPEAT